MIVNLMVYSGICLAAASPATGDQRNTTLPIVFGVIALVLIAASIIAGVCAKKDKNDKKK